MDNTVKTVLLLGGLTGIIIGIGSFWGTNGIAIGLAFAVIMNFVSYFFSSKLVLMMYKAKEVTEKEEPELYKMVREVVHLASIPMPKVYLVQSSNPNAFATGRNPKHAAVAFTTGILGLLDKDELKGVIAHEISHVMNRDILIGTIAATLAGVISYIGIMARWSAIFGGLGGDRDNSNGFVSIIVLGIITPIMAFLIQMAISRSREYQADKSAAKLLHNPHGLIKALQKLETGVRRNPMVNTSNAAASLFIVNPFSLKGISKMLSTHPSTESRIEKLKSYA
jgi:heat shock protein HtpX